MERIGQQTICQLLFLYTKVSCLSLSGDYDRLRSLTQIRVQARL
jgi:hypothetical protein